MKLWQKDKQQTADWIEEFTVGRDREFDLQLAEYDVMGSIAHTTMLQSIGLLTAEEFMNIHAALNAILAEIHAGNFKIDDGAEDIHSLILGKFQTNIDAF